MKKHEQWRERAQQLVESFEKQAERADYEADVPARDAYRSAAGQVRRAIREMEQAWSPT